MAGFRSWQASFIFAWMAGCAFAEPGDELEDSAAQSLTLDTRDSLQHPLSASSQRLLKQQTAANGQLPLLARVEVQEGELIEFYELSPGVVGLSGAGAPTGRPVYAEAPAIESGDVEALWAQISHGAAMPKELAAAMARSDARAERIHQSATTPRTQKVIAPPSSGTPQTDQLIAKAAGGWCETSWNTVVISGYTLYPAAASTALGFCFDWKGEWKVCLDRITGDMWANHNDVLGGRGSVCPYRGNITYRISADENWVSTGSWNVPQNTYRWFSVADRPCEGLFNDCVQIKTEVKDAANDGYNFRMEVAPGD